MKSELAEEILELIEARSQNRPTPMDFEMAYQVRIATDRIRFAIKHTEQFAASTDQMREVGFQLLDALERLEVVDRRFQAQSRMRFGKDAGDHQNTRVALHKTEAGSLQQPYGRHAGKAHHPGRSD